MKQAMIAAAGIAILSFVCAVESVAPLNDADPLTLQNLDQVMSRLEKELRDVNSSTTVKNVLNDALSFARGIVSGLKPALNILYRYLTPFAKLLLKNANIDVCNPNPDSEAETLLSKLIDYLNREVLIKVGSPTLDLCVSAAPGAAQPQKKQGPPKGFKLPQF